jgi:hypothetical protein
MFDKNRGIMMIKNGYRAGLLAVAMATAGTFGSTLAAPAAYVERNLAFGVNYGLGAQVVGLEAGIELPIPLSFPIDLGAGLSVATDVGFKAISVDLSVKALLLPALGGNPPLAVGLTTDVGFDFGAAFGWSFGLGPIISADFSPIVVTAALLPRLGSGGFGLDLLAGVRYYFDPFALDLDASYSVGGGFSVGAGLRWLF